MRINKAFVRRGLEFLGIEKFSRPALCNIDSILEKYIKEKEGFFVEAGANDGYSCSNTYFLEKFHGWRGILIEGIPELARKCAKERTKSIVVNCALVSPDYPEKYVKMYYANHMSLVSGARKSPEKDMEWIHEGCKIQGVQSYEVSVIGKTLTEVFEEHNVKTIDLLSLDVEGYEYDVLRGLDFNKFRPIYILVEANFRQEIIRLLEMKNYGLLEEIEGNNLLFMTKPLN